MSEGLIVMIPSFITAVSVVITQLIISAKNSNTLSLKQEMILERLKTLEEKQEKHNGWIERLIVTEQSTKSAHKRLDGIGAAHAE